MTDLPYYTEGVCSDGAAILRDGVMMPIEDIVSELNRLTALAHPAPADEIAAASLRAAALYCKRDKLILLRIADELEALDD